MSDLPDDANTVDNPTKRLPSYQSPAAKRASSERLTRVMASMYGPSALVEAPQRSAVTLVIDERGRHLPAPTFSYAGLNAEFAERLRKQADTIRSRVRSQTDAMIAIGRDLAEIKGNLEHGAFAAWVEAECGIQPRLAQLYMRAAEWAPSNTKLVSHLQPTSVMKLSGKSTPPKVIEEVAIRIDAGETVSTAKVEALLAKARREKEEQARLAKEAAVPKRTKEARKARLARQEREAEERRRKFEEEERQTKQQIEELAGILVANLDREQLERVKAILENRDVTGRAFHCGVAYVPLLKTIEEMQRARPSAAEPEAAKPIEKPGAVTIVTPVITIGDNPAPFHIKRAWAKYSDQPA